MPARLLLLLLALLLPCPGVSDRGSCGGGHLGAAGIQAGSGGGGPRHGAPRRRLGLGVGGGAPRGASASWPARVAAAAASPAEAHATRGASWASAAVTGSASPGLVRNSVSPWRHLGVSRRPRTLGRPPHLPDPPHRWAPTLPGAGGGGKTERAV